MKFCYDCANIIKEDVEKCPFCGGNLNDAEPKEAYHLRPGTTLKNGRYFIGRAIGYGGFGITYAGFDVVLQRRIAVKEYFPSGFANRVPETKQISVYTGDRRAQYAAGLSRFLLEARNMAKFGKETNIVSVLDFFEENNTAYIVMEYLDGMDLKHYLRQVGGILPYQQAIEIIKPIFRALTKVHKEGVVHRDISPDNIFITDDNIIKLIDFGAARLALGDREKTLSVILKPGFAPPEQYRKKSIQGAFTDIYALGATFYRMITGKVPDDSVDRVMEDELEPPSAVIGSIPKAIDAAVMKAMALDYRARFQSAADFLKALDEGQNGMAVPTVSDNSADETNAEYYEPRLISETDKTVAMGYGRSNVIKNGYAGSIEPSKPSKSVPPSEAKKAAAPASDPGRNVKAQSKLFKIIAAVSLAICMLFAILMISGVIKFKSAIKPNVETPKPTERFAGNVTANPTSTPTSTPTPTPKPAPEIPIDAAHFPDANFRAWVSANCDTDGSGSLSPAEIAAVKGINVLKVQYTPEEEKISNLTGIEYFTALTYLFCGGNQLTALDVSKNTALMYLNCGDDFGGNQLTSLDVSKNTVLEKLSCSSNQLTSLDVSKNTALTELDCHRNQLTQLDVSKNTALTEFDCSGNQLTSLDVSKNTVLTEFDCSGNQLTQLDISKNTALTEFDCSGNELTSLDVSKNTVLTEFDCHYNQLTQLDISKNTALTGLYCCSSQLTSLDVSKNTALTKLECYDNQLTSLDVSKNTALTFLDCAYNQISNLSSFSGLTKLTKLNLVFNNLTASTDVSPLFNLTKLETLDITYGNSLTQTQIDAIKSHLPNCTVY